MRGEYYLPDAGVGRQTQLLQPGQVGDVGQVPELRQLVIGEGQAGQAAGQVRAAFAEKRRDVGLRTTNVQGSNLNLDLSGRVEPTKVTTVITANHLQY